MVVRTLGTLLIAFSTMGVAHAFGTPNGDGTYLPPPKAKSTLKRADVVSNIPADRGFQGDGTVKSAEAPLSKVSRDEVQRKMDNYEFVGTGDGTTATPWVRKSSPTATATASQAQ